MDVAVSKVGRSHEGERNTRPRRHTPSVRTTRTNDHDPRTFIPSVPQRPGRGDLRVDLRAAGRDAGQLRARRFGDAVLAGDRRVPFGAGRRRLAVAIRQAGTWPAPSSKSNWAWPCWEGRRRRSCFSASATCSWFQGLLFLIVFAIGVLVGLELPLLMRILQGAPRFQRAGVARAGVRLHRGARWRRCCFRCS